MKYIDGYVQINNLYLKEIPEILNGVHIKGDFDVSFNVLKIKLKIFNSIPTLKLKI